jgi:hypothetical protein
MDMARSDEFIRQALLLLIDIAFRICYTKAVKKKLNGYVFHSIPSIT